MTRCTFRKIPRFLSSVWPLIWIVALLVFFLKAFTTWVRDVAVLGFQVLSVLLILGNNVGQIFQVNLRQSLFPEPKGGELLKWGRSGYFSLTWGSSTTGKLYKILLMRWIFATPVCGNRDQSHPCQLEETPGPPYRLAQCTWTNMWSVLTSSCDILGSKGFRLFRTSLLEFLVIVRKTNPGGELLSNIVISIPWDYWMSFIHSRSKV